MPLCLSRKINQDVIVTVPAAEIVAAARAVVSCRPEHRAAAIEHLSDVLDRTPEREVVIVAIGDVKRDGSVRLDLTADRRVNIRRGEVPDDPARRNRAPVPRCPSCRQPRPNAVGPDLFEPGSKCPTCGHVEPQPECEGVVA